MELKDCGDMFLIEELKRRLLSKGEQIEQTPKKNLYEAKCTMCGEMTSVPFIPNAGYPVKCFKCYQKIKQG